MHFVIVAFRQKNLPDEFYELRTKGDLIFLEERTATPAPDQPPDTLVRRHDLQNMPGNISTEIIRRMLVHPDRKKNGLGPLTEHSFYVTGIQSIALDDRNLLPQRSG